jgi:RNA polymerase sigma factor for flagellar operon FliA
VSLSEAELSQLWEVYVEDRDGSLLELLVLHYEPLARYLARRALAKAPPYQDPEDILSYAHHGLLNAIERFDPSKGFKFETYATRRISGAIIDGQRKQDPLGRQLRKRIKAMAAAQDELWNVLGRQPTVDEVADQMGETTDVVRELVLAQQTVAGSLNETDDQGPGLAETLVGECEAEVRLEVRELRDGLAELLARLDLRDRIFVLLHYCEQKTFGEVGAALGVSEARCGQLRQEVITALMTG